MLLEKYIGRERMSGFAFGRAPLQAGMMLSSLTKTFPELATQAGTKLSEKGLPSGRSSSSHREEVVSVWGRVKAFRARREGWAGHSGWPR